MGTASLIEAKGKWITDSTMKRESVSELRAQQQCIAGALSMKFRMETESILMRRCSCTKKIAISQNDFSQSANPPSTYQLPLHGITGPQVRIFREERGRSASGLDQQHIMDGSLQSTGSGFLGMCESGFFYVKLCGGNSSFS